MKLSKFAVKVILGWCVVLLYFLYLTAPFHVPARIHVNGTPSLSQDADGK